MKFNAEEEDVADIHFRLHPSDCIWAEFREDFVWARTVLLGSLCQVLRVYAFSAGCILLPSLGGSFKLAGLGTRRTWAAAAQGSVWVDLPHLNVMLYCCRAAETQMTPAP